MYGCYDIATPSQQYTVIKDSICTVIGTNTLF